MPKSVNQKQKLLFLLDYLRQNTDETHTVTTPQIIDHLAANGIRAERKSIYNDIQTLCDYGYDIIRTEGAHAGYHIADRTFELPEVKLLVDLVQSSKFITTKKSRQLIGKLEQLVSKNDAKKLQRQVVVADRNKTSNEKIYYSVDVIHSAIAENRQIRFHYFDWNVRKEMQLRKNGRFYQVSPWLLTWDDENYYLVAYDADAGKMKHYRVDKMTEITATAKRIAAGSYGVQIPKHYDDEIGELADTINDMSVKIGQAEKTQSEFISSVSHELRTPLTAISGWGETLLASGDLEPETKRGMLIILREARRLTGMVEELLEFTRMQDGRFTLNIETADILAEFEDTVFMYGSRLKQEGITLNYDGCDEEIPEIPCDIARMRQVFLNILDNAAKHGGDGKRIDAAISAEDGEVVFRIRDYGPGIPEEELPHVKMKFYKGSSKARGSGIGLAVCEEIVTMHGGTLTLENAEGGGTLVTVRLPMGEESR